MKPRHYIDFGKKWCAAYAVSRYVELGILFAVCSAVYVLGSDPPSSVLSLLKWVVFFVLGGFEWLVYYVLFLSFKYNFSIDWGSY